jgi:superfamily I DNA/RNA helicase
VIEIQIAGAGGGKTHGMAKKIISHYDPESHKVIYAITYTNAAAINISDKLMELLGFLPENIKVCTVHTFLLNEIIYPYSPFILDEVYTTSSRCRLYSSFPTGKSADKIRNESKSTITRLRRIGVIHVDEVYNAAWRVVDESYSAHSSQRKKSKVRKVLKLLSSSIEKIFLDEAQDLNEIALKAFMEIGTKSVNIYMVGDPKQAIKYPKAFKGWIKDNKDNENLTFLPNIETSRRVPQTILNLSNRFCPKDQKQISESDVEGRLSYITSKDDYYEEVLNYHIQNVSLVSIYQKTRGYSTKSSNDAPEFDPEIEQVLIDQYKDFDEQLIIGSAQRWFAKVLSEHGSPKSIQKFMDYFGIEYDKEIYKKLYRTIESYESSKENVGKYGVSSITKTKGLEAEVCILVLTAGIHKYLMQNDATKYNKTWNMVYVALTRAASELVIAVDMDLLDKEFNLNDVVNDLESLGFKPYQLGQGGLK